MDTEDIVLDVVGVLFIITMISLLLFLVFSFFGILVFGILGDNSEGVRIGIPVKLSYKGWIWKTWEGELMVRGVLTEGIPYVWEFSICDRDEAKIKKITEAIEGQKTIEIKYSSKIFNWRWNQKTEYCVEEIKEIK